MTDNIKKKLLEKYGEDYVRALSFTSSAEGAFANRKADKGGITYKGISQVYNPKWAGWNVINRYLDKYPELKIPYKGKPPARSVEHQYQQRHEWYKWNQVRFQL